MTTNHPCLACQEQLDRPDLARTRYLFGAGFSIKWIVTCPSCGLGQVDHLPSADSIDRYYRELTTQDLLAGLTDEEVARHGRPGRLDSCVRYAADRLGLDLGAPLTFLDVGAGNGRLVNSVGTHTAWTTVAVEPDATKCRTMRRFGLEPINEVFDDCAGRFADGSMDFVSVNQVLEHLPEPRRTLSGILRVMAPGGALWIDVPNCTADYFANRLTDFVPHLTFWNDGALRAFVEAAGFQVVATGSFGSALPTRLPASARLKRDARNWLSWHLPLLWKTILRLRTSAAPPAAARVLSADELGRERDIPVHENDFRHQKLFCLARKPA